MFEKTVFAMEDIGYLASDMRYILESAKTAWERLGDPLLMSERTSRMGSFPWYFEDGGDPAPAVEALLDQLMQYQKEYEACLRDLDKLVAQL